MTLPHRASNWESRQPVDNRESFGTGGRMMMTQRLYCSDKLGQENKLTKSSVMVTAGANQYHGERRCVLHLISKYMECGMRRRSLFNLDDVNILEILCRSFGFTLNILEMYNASLYGLMNRSIVYEI